MGYSGAGGKLIHEKNQKQKISWHCPFNIAAATVAAALFSATVFWFCRSFAAATPVVAAAALAIIGPVTSLDLLGNAVSSLHCLFLARVCPPSSRRVRAHSNFDGEGKRGYVTVAVSMKQKFSYLSKAFGCSPCTYFYFDPPNRPSVYSTLHDRRSGISCHCVLSPLHLQLSYSKAKTAAFPPSQFLASGKGTRDIRRVHCKHGHITRAILFRLLLCVFISHCKRYKHS